MSDTDPRLLACAKALLKPDFEWDQIGDDFRQRAIKAARACILTWLERAPTASMFDEVERASAPLCRAEYEHIYAAMCAQAIKEITYT